MKLWLSRVSVFLLVMLPFTGMAAEPTQAQSGHHNVSGRTIATDHHHMGQASGRWEGSPEGTAFSEFNHHFAGLCDVVFGLAELGYALQYPLPLWTRLILPGGLGIVGGFVLIWSDHDAWPIGSLGFSETFFGHDREIVEHKTYGVLALLIALCETLRRLGRVRHPMWAAPLVIATLAGSLWLLVHSHGDHPAIEKIQLQHSLLAIVGIGAALSKGFASWFSGISSHATKRWEVAWAGSVILFGLLLLVYSQ
ncbi:MAG: hypothetical protein HC938_03125 [Nitrospira sp.]|nr:hypothetical protein [Nitrospira sp.]